MQTVRNLAAIPALLALEFRDVSAGSVATSATLDGVAGATPVAKVVTLLKDMQQTLETEAANDEEVHEKLACWCETNDKEKSKSVEELNARITDLLTVIDSTAAASARLKEEIANHEADLAKSQESLDTATALREKQHSEFNAEEKDMLQSISALKSAITVLSKHHPQAAFLDASAAEAAAKALELARAQFQAHQKLLRGVITPHQRRVVLALQEESKQPVMGGDYAPGSGEIFGILKQMKETFENDLAETRKEETANKQAYDGMKAAKVEEITATQQSIEQKQEQLAAADEENAQAKEEIEDSRVMLVDDNGFLMTVKQKCKLSEQEYQVRVQLRQEEIQAVVEAISILSNDDARDQFRKSYGFLQVNARQASVGKHEQDDVRKQAANVLRQASLKAGGNPQLGALAARVQLDAFTKVKEAIDNMVTELLQEKQDEIKHRDSCISEQNENTRLTEREERTKAELQATKEGLEMTIKEKQDSIKNLEAEITELNTQIKRKGEDREFENKDFQTTVADHRETQALLQKAIAVLKAVYEKRNVVMPTAGSLVQAKKGKKQEPDEEDPFAPKMAPEAPKYDEYKGGKAASGGVVALIEQIYNEAVNMEKDVLKQEQDAQAEYELFVKETNAAIASKQLAIVNTSEDMEKAKQQLITTEDDLTNSVTQLEQLSNTKGALHQSCDFILRNFDVRQEARDDEVEALRQAKAILSGMQVE